MLRISMLCYVYTNYSKEIHLGATPFSRAKEFSMIPGKDRPGKLSSTEEMPETEKKGQEDTITVVASQIFCGL